MTTGKLVLMLVVVGLLGVGMRFVLFDARQDEQPRFGSPFSSGRDDAAADRLEQLPKLRLPDLEGQEIAGSQWDGKILVLNFWATWCPPCLRELPLFDELQRTYADAGLQVVGIAIDNKEDVERFLAEHPVDFPILLGDTTTIELSRRLGNRVQGLPFTAIFDSHGKWVHGHSGEMTRAALTEQLDPLLSHSDGT